MDDTGKNHTTQDSGVTLHLIRSSSLTHVFVCFAIAEISTFLPTIDQANITITTKSRTMKFIGPGSAKSTNRQTSIATVKGSIQ